MSELVVSRIFEAPLDRVWRMWTDPALVMQWWGPDHFTCPSAVMDFREGGTSIVCMRAPATFGGRDNFSIWTYTKIVLHERIEFIQNLASSDGHKQKPLDLGMPSDFPEDVRTVVTFRSLGKNRTEMTVTEYANFGQMSHFAKLGLEQSIGKMKMAVERAKGSD
ncbi:MAG: SRPBCC domain-containing protein [Bacteroidetes bacterium]|nr:SRPBCC domain-containing protein [Bacteroidota bacterium]